MFLIAFLLSFALVDGQSNERIYPSNTAVIAGKQFYLICENYSDRITTKWKFLRVGTYADREIYNGIHILDEFKSFQVHSTSYGLSNLTKPNASMDDAGTYKCIQSNGTYYDVSSAQVTVLDTDPVCSPKETNVLEGKYLWINCSVHYIGSISPIMKWTMGDGMDADFDENIANVSNSSSVISSLKMNATRRYNNAIFQCTTYFNQPIISNEDQGDIRKAINAPTYEHQCTSRINILFEPETVDIIPKKEVYTVGEVLLCNADGNPTPTYEWTELGSNRVVSRESSLTLDSTAMGNNAYKCTATNNATGKETSISTIVTILAIILSPTGSSHGVWAITIVAGVILCVVLVLMIFTVGIKRFKGCECLSALMRREGDYGPDIVQNADENGDERYAVEGNGYAHPEDLGLRAPPIQQRRFAAEARDEGAFLSRNEREAVPVYSEVQKKKQGFAGVEIPVYGKVQKSRDENAACLEHAASASKADDIEVCHGQASSKKQMIGTDGIQYMDMGDVRSVARLGTPSLPPRPPLFERSHYAEIDHTKSFPK